MSSTPLSPAGQQAAVRGNVVARGVGGGMLASPTGAMSVAMQQLRMTDSANKMQIAAENGE
jgi:hypothetical protein